METINGNHTGHFDKVVIIIVVCPETSQLVCFGSQMHKFLYKHTISIAVKSLILLGLMNKYCMATRPQFLSKINDLRIIPQVIDFIVSGYLSLSLINRSMMAATSARVAVSAGAKRPPLRPVIRPVSWQYSAASCAQEEMPDASV